MNNRLIYAGVLAGSLFFLGACGNTGNDVNEASDGTVLGGTEMLSDEHHAAISLDYFGTYVGVMPCADCDGIPVEVVIAADSTFRHTTSGPDSDSLDVLTGKWEIDRNTITLGVEGPIYHVAENRLIPIGDDGSRYTGELEEQFSLHKLD